MSLLELTVVIAGITVLLAALTPSLLRQVNQRRADAVRAEVELLHQAMVGGDDGTSGYVGDLGRLPLALSELVVSGAQPLYTVSEASGIGRGWNGPYINIGRDLGDFERDPWGKPYDFDVFGAGQIRSAGPDGLFGDSDDIVFPPAAVDVYGSVVVVVKGHAGTRVIVDPVGCVVSLTFSDGGNPGVVTDASTPFSFVDVHRGPHSVVVECTRADGVATERTAVVVRGGGAQQVVELHVELAVTVPPAEPAETLEGSGFTGNPMNTTNQRTAGTSAGGRR